METIKKYLEAMFANLPRTPEVIKAKDELWQMMEDKYTELIGEGKTENEAVGTVISEFGNLEDLADVLGLSVAPDADTKFDKEHNILCLRNTEYFFSGKEISDDETLNRLQRLHSRLEEVRNI